MKISESTSYPHPVLAPWSEDITGATFEVDISYREEETAGQLSIHCDVSLDQSNLLRFIQDGSATFGCFVKCQETGFRRLQQMGFPVGAHHFAPGALLGRVQIRPLIWSLKPIQDYYPTGVHPEFDEPLDLAAGQILALDIEQVLDVTRPPLSAIESLFEIKSSADIEDGRFEIDPELDRVTITMGEKTYDLVQRLRETDDDTRAVVMNSLYIPIVMEVLAELAESEWESFEEFRWLNPFRARCELANVDIKNVDLFNDAHKLLALPFSSLGQLTESQGE